MAAEPRTLYRQGTATEVQEVMSTDVVTVLNTESVRDALDKLTKEHISAVPVINGKGNFVGIVSVADLVRTVLATDEVLDSDYPHYEDSFWAVDLIQQRLGSDKVTRVMSEVLTTIAPDESMHDAACIMLNHHVHHLPVVNSTGKLVGMLSSTDFVRLAAGNR